MQPGHFAEPHHSAALLLLGAFAFGNALAAPRVEPVPDASRDAQQQAIAARFASSTMTNAVATYLAHPALAEAVLPYAQYAQRLRATGSTPCPAALAHGVAHALRLSLGTPGAARAAQRGYARGARAHRTRPYGGRLERLRRDIAASGRRAARRLIPQRRDWAAMKREYDTNQLIDLVYGVGDLTMHAGVLNTLGVAIEDDVEERLPSGIPYIVRPQWTNQRLQGKEPRIAPLQPHEWSPEVRRGSTRGARVAARMYLRRSPAIRRSTRFAMPCRVTSAAAPLCRRGIASYS